MQEQRLDLAEESFKAAVASCEKAVGTNDLSLVDALGESGEFLWLGPDRFDLATPLVLRILDLVKESSPPDEVQLRRRSQAVGDVYRAQGQFAQAEPTIKQVMAHAGTNSADISSIMRAWRLLPRLGKRTTRPEALCQRVLTTREKAAETNPAVDEQITLAKSLFGLAENYHQWGKRDQAEAFYRRSLAVGEKSVGEDQPDLGWPRAGLAALLAEEGKTNEAAVALPAGLRCGREECSTNNNPMLQSICKAYVALLNTMNRTSEADAIQQNFQWKSLMYDSMRTARRRPAG